LTTVLLVNAGELKEAWTNANLSDGSASATMSTATSASTKQEKKKVVVVQINNDSTKAHSLYLIDGKKVSAEDIKALDPKTIASVDVWKDSAAIHKYGEEGKNGVVVISIKGKEGTYAVVTQNRDKGKSSYVMIVTTAQQDSLSVNNGNMDHSASKMKILSSNGNNNNPLIIVDGIGTDYKAMNQIDPNTIESVTILKDASVTKLYGTKGKNGVILITLKKKIESN
jgi:TonB-dependent SusC/RagA subfamily outer membrane receptor